MLGPCLAKLLGLAIRTILRARHTGQGHLAPVETTAKPQTVSSLITRQSTMCRHKMGLAPLRRQKCRVSCATRLLRLDRRNSLRT